MNPVQQAVNDTGGTVSVVHLMIAEGNVPWMAEEPEKVMEEIEQRATSVGPVLEAIFHEPHGQVRWGLNE